MQLGGATWQLQKQITCRPWRSPPLGPALAEAKLLTDKHARDAVYVVTLAAELRSIEDKIVAMEEALQLVSQQEDALALGRGCRTPQDGPDAHWIRAKSLAFTNFL